MKLSQLFSNTRTARSPLTRPNAGRRRRARRGGSVITMVAVSMIMVMGCGAIAIDYGVLVSDANQLQRACDAAALAGAQKLYTSGLTTSAITYDQYYASQAAVEVAKKNGVTIAPSDVTFPTPTKIQVLATRKRSLFFAQALGRSDGTVIRQATAGRIGLRGTGHAVPLAMTTDDYLANRDGKTFDYTLINNHESDFAKGTVASLDLRPDNSGKSGAVFQEDLTYGYNGTIYIDQKISNSLNADINSQGSKLISAMNDRFTMAAAAPYYDNGSNYTYPNYPSGDPRVMLIIVAPPNPAANNNPTLSAQFFAPVYVESVRNASSRKVLLRLRILPVWTYSSQDQYAVLDSDLAPVNGPSVISLIS